MKHIASFINNKSKRELSKRMKTMISEWATQAYRLDGSKPISHYYELFTDQLRQKYSEIVKINDIRNKKIIKDFIRTNTIEV